MLILPLDMLNTFSKFTFSCFQRRISKFSTNNWRRRGKINEGWGKIKDDKGYTIVNISNRKHEGSDSHCKKSVKLSCDDGYKTSGCATDDCKVTCERGGTWSSKLPTCEKKSCGGLITLTLSNPQIILNIPKSDLNNKVNCIWFVVTESEEEINVDFPQSFKSSNCKERFVFAFRRNCIRKHR